jgi:hypothetical protein
MAAGLGYKEFATGDVLTAADANGYLASQVVMVFADSAARTSAIASPQEGMFSFLKDTNSTEYYSGSAWVAVGGGGGSSLPAFSAYSTTNQSISSGVWTKVTFGAEDFDTNSNFASSRFTPTVAGYYQLNAAAMIGAASSGSDQYMAIYKNGSNYKTIGRSNLSIDNTISGSSVVYLNGSTDYVEIYVNKSGNSPVVFDFSSLGTLFNGVGVRS